MTETSVHNKPDILCFSSSDWHGNWGSRQQVMRRFAARGYRVLYIEQMAGLEHLWRYGDLRRRRKERRAEGLVEIETNVWLYSPPPLVPGRYYSRFVAQLNAQLVTRDMKRTLAQLDFRDPILWLYLPEHAPLVGRFGERLSVYHCIDEWTVGARGHKRHMVASLEKELVSLVNVVFANSRLTAENKRRWNTNTHRIPSGADVKHFAAAAGSATVHPDVANLPHPVLAFAGNINEKIDIPLLVTVAREKPDWSIVLVGRHNPRAVDMRELNELPNVHTLGERPFETIPSLLRAADVCLLPYVQGEATRYRSPLKLYEYLATGKPIVSTPHPEVDEWSDTVSVAPAEHFVEAIEKAIGADTPERKQQRMEIARQHSWDARVDTMEAILAQHL